MILLLVDVDNIDGWLDEEHRERSEKHRKVAAWFHQFRFSPLLFGAVDLSQASQSTECIPLENLSATRLSTFGLSMVFGTE
jgi:hypothetical protein